MPQVLESQFRITGRDDTKAALSSAAANAEKAAQATIAASDRATQVAERNAKRLARLADPSSSLFGPVDAARNRAEVMAAAAERVAKRHEDIQRRRSGNDVATIERQVAATSEAIGRAAHDAERQVGGATGRMTIQQRAMFAGLTGLATGAVGYIAGRGIDVGRRIVGASIEWNNALERLSERTGVSTDKINKQVRDSVNRYGADIKVVMSGIQEAIASGAKPDVFFGMLDELIKAHRVTGAGITDIWRAVEGTMQSFPTVGPQRALDLITGAMKEGNIGIDQMSEKLPKLGQVYTRFGDTSEVGLKRLLGMMVAMSKQTGDTETALQGLMGFLNAASGQANFGAFKEFGVDLEFQFKVAKEQGKDLASVLLELTRKAVEYGHNVRHMTTQDILTALFGDDNTRQAMIPFMDISREKFRGIVDQVERFKGLDPAIVQKRMEDDTAAVNRLTNGLHDLSLAFGGLMNAVGVVRFVNTLTDDFRKLSSLIDESTKNIADMEGKLSVFSVPGLVNALAQSVQFKDTWLEIKQIWEILTRLWDSFRDVKALNMERPAAPPLPQGTPTVPQPEQFRAPPTAPTVTVPASPTNLPDQPAPQRTAPATSGPDAPGSASERTQRSVLDTLKTMLIRSIMVAGRAVDSTYGDGSGLPAGTGAPAGAAGGAGNITPTGGRGLRGGTAGRANVRYGGQGAVRAGGGQGPGAGGVGRTPGVGGELAHGQGAALLDAISRAEGTRGYNDSYAHQLKDDLSGKTLNEIDKIQAGMRGSSAIGRYQFMRKTLHGLRQELGLSGEEKFTPELQDRLGRRLLQRRGYDKFMRGEMTREQFMKNVSTEWAGVTDAAGISTHAGVGHNKQTASTVGAIDAAIARDRAGYRGPEATPAAQPGVPLAGGDPHITSPFGMRNHPLRGGRRLHAGTDYRGAAGSPVMATGAGTVTNINRMGDVTVRHADGTSSVYRHVDAAVREGQEVAAGERIAALKARDPRMTGPHLHYERRDAQGQPYDPSGEVSAAARGRNRPAARDPDRTARDGPQAEAKPITVPVHFAYHGMGEVNQRGRSQARREFNREVADTRRRSYSDVGVA